MNENLKAFVRRFIEGAKETPRKCFAPLMALLRWMDRVTGHAMRESTPRKPLSAVQDEREPSLSHEEPDVYQAAISTIKHARETLDEACLAAFDKVEERDVELATMAVEVLGAREHAARWMARPLSALHRRSAFEVASVGGRERVIALLHAIQYGMHV